MGNQLEKLNNSMRNVNETANNISDTLMLANSSFDRINELGSLITGSVNNILDLQKDMHMMDLQFNAYIANIDAELERHKGNLPIVEKQLDKISQLMDKILDKVLEADPQNESEMDYKLRMMESLDKYTDTISTMMIKLL